MPKKKEEEEEKKKRFRMIKTTTPGGIRPTRFGIGGREVSPEEFKSRQQEARILAAGGHKARTTAELIRAGLLPGEAPIEGGVAPEEVPAEVSPEEARADESFRVAINRERERQGRAPITDEEFAAEVERRKPFETIGGTLGGFVETLKEDPLKIVEDIPLALGMGAIPTAIGSSVMATPGATAQALVGLTSELGRWTKIIAGGAIIGLLTASAKRMESQVSKAGESLTKLAESVVLGFYLDDDGNIAEYTEEMGLRAVDEIEAGLNEAESELKRGSIGNSALKISGFYKNAVGEIEKQRKEITVARGKIVAVQLNPSEELLKKRAAFRSLEFLEQLKKLGELK